MSRTAPTAERSPGARPAPGDDAPIRVGISSCLLGEEVRWDGGHKRDPFLTDVLGRFVEWVPVCPELELRMGVPREPVRLVERRGRVHMVAVKGGEDWTHRMSAWAARRARALAGLELCGYVLKKGSPSCGMERGKLYPESGGSRRQARGLFAEALMEQHAMLPVEEEGRLNDPVLRESWIERVFAYRRVRSLFAARWTLGDLVAFHTAHKLQVLSHSPQAYARLGRLVASARRGPSSGGATRPGSCRPSRRARRRAAT